MAEKTIVNKINKFAKADKLIKNDKQKEKVADKVIGVLDIGSNELRLKVAQINKNASKVLESLTYPLSLGKDTFYTGKISFEKVDKACDIIRNFLVVAKEYGATEIQAVATTAVREALNKDYILDQIEIKTGIKVRVLDNYEEKFYIYKMMTHFIDSEYKDSALMVYIGSGNIGISLLNDNKIPFIQSIKIGSLRINELFDAIHAYSSEFHLILEEYLDSFTDQLNDELPEDISHFIASGNEIQLIGELCGCERDEQFLYINRDKFMELYEDVKFKTADTIAFKYNITNENASILVAATCIYKNLIEFTNANVIMSPIVFISDALLYEMFYPKLFNSITKEYNKSTLLSSKIIARRFQVMESHSDTVEKFSIKIFDKMKKIHGMGSRQKLLLQSASILHDIGKFVNINKHYEHSYNIIKGLDIIGLNARELEILANICLYHSKIVPANVNDNYTLLSKEDKVLVSKLVAIFRISDALDRSHLQKFDDIDVKLTNDELIVTIATDKNIELEEWSFISKGKFFEEVFGLKTIIKKKKVN